MVGMVVAFGMMYHVQRLTVARLPRAAPHPLQVAKLVLVHRWKRMSVDMVVVVWAPSVTPTVLMEFPQRLSLRVRVVR